MCNLANHLENNIKAFVFQWGSLTGWWHSSCLFYCQLQEQSLGAELAWEWWRNELHCSHKWQLFSGELIAGYKHSINEPICRHWSAATSGLDCAALLICHIVWQLFWFSALFFWLAVFLGSEIEICPAGRRRKRLLFLLKHNEYEANKQYSW